MTHHQHAQPRLDQPQHGGLVPELIELEAEALRDLTDAITRWVADVVGTAPRHVLDLGSGTGAGTFALLERFPGARASAVDSSPSMLARLERRGAERGLTGRLTTVRTDLDDGLPSLGGVDLVWASSSVHHLGDPDRLLAEVAGALPADGWFVLVETEDVPWFLPEDVGVGRSGLERRCHELFSERRAAELPDVGTDWAARLTSAGLVVTASRVIDADVPAPLPAPARRHARMLFSVLRGAARDRLDAEDAAALDVLLDDADPRSLARREDLTLRATREVWAARRPHDGEDAPRPTSDPARTTRPPGSGARRC